MSALVSLTLFGWIPLVMILFMLLPPRRAVVSAFIIAWLFLPIAQFKLVGLLPNYDKISATCLGVFLAGAVFDAGRFANFRPAWYDIPMLIWCLVPIPSAMSTGYGMYEGLSGVMYQAITWGVPYLIGRIYFNSLEGLHELAMGVIIGGIVYIPLCLYEIRMSPQLHTMVYGFHQHDFGQSRRGGGWRPTVFMQHGLAVATYMCTATLLTAWMAFSEKRRVIYSIPLWVYAFVIFATAVLCKSSGATLLMLGGLAMLLFIRFTKLTLPAWGLLAIPFLYMFSRTMGGWDASSIREFARLISDRAEQSVGFRLDSEDALWESVRPRMLLGATRFYWASINPEEGRRIVPDGLWILALGRFGVVGVVSVFACFAVPAIVFLRRFNPRTWSHPMVAVAAAWMMNLLLWSMDCLSNAMVNPIFLLAAGGLAAAPAIVAATAPRGRGRTLGPSGAPPANVPPSIINLGPRHASSFHQGSIPARLPARTHSPGSRQP